MEKTALECSRLKQLFPETVKPTLFLLPINRNTPYGCDCFKALLDMYDKRTKARLELLPGGNFRVNQYTLEKMEPNLRKGYFTEALGFYELTADPDVLLQALLWRNDTLGRFYNNISIKDIAGYVTARNLIREVHVVAKSGDHTAIVNKKSPLVVINAAGPWMAETAKGLGILLPIEFSLGVQVAIPRKYCFQSAIITFTREGQYTICIQKKDHIQIGPTNTPFDGSPDKIFIGEKDITPLANTFREITEPEPMTGQPMVKSAGLRVKLKLPFSPDTNRPFIFQTGYENYFVAYPGKTALALTAADELLARARPFLKSISMPGIGNKISRPSHSLDGNKKYKNILKLNLFWLKSMFKFGIHTALYFIKLPFKK